MGGFEGVALLDGIQLFHFNGIQISLVGYSVCHICFYIIVIPLQLFLHGLILIQLFFQKQNTEKQLINPFVDSVHIYFQLLLVCLGCSAGDAFCACIFPPSHTTWSSWSMA